MKWSSTHLYKLHHTKILEAEIAMAYKETVVNWTLDWTERAFTETNNATTRHQRSS